MFLKGGVKILIVGDWYMKGHEYSIQMGNKKTPARLIRPGVLSFVAPPGNFVFYYHFPTYYSHFLL